MCDILGCHSGVLAHSSRRRCYIVGWTSKYRPFEGIFYSLSSGSSNRPSLCRRSHSRLSKSK